MPKMLLADETLPLNVLVLDDDLIVAIRLCTDLRRMGASIIGPFAEVNEAIDHLDVADAAILDVRLRDDTAFPLADCLRHRRTPFLFYTALDREALPGRFRDVPHFSKPMATEVLVSQLKRAPKPIPDLPPPAVEASLPMLRHQARLLLHDAAAADRLVESALRAALQRPLAARSQPQLDRALERLLLEIYRRRGSALLN